MRESDYPIHYIPVSNKFSLSKKKKLKDIRGPIDDYIRPNKSDYPSNIILSSRGYMQKEVQTINKVLQSLKVTQLFY